MFPNKPKNGHKPSDLISANKLKTMNFPEKLRNSLPNFE